MTDLSDLEKLLGEATPGEWFASPADDKAGARWFVQTNPGAGALDVCAMSNWNQEANARLFVAMKAALPALPALIERLRSAEARVAVLEGNLRRVTDHLEEWARYHGDECTAEIDAAIYCSRQALETTHDPR